ncbi:hypothetical protein HED60_05255 [Planctomycetales bacterium ZRK34]|nr:hypothetical protein HED60_05255 [Planctomycetales bacterium ZRK34]
MTQPAAWTLALVAVLTISMSASAATLTGVAQANPVSPADLTALSVGGDWAVWTSTSNPRANGTPNNRKDNVTALIGDVSNILGANTRGVTVSSTQQISYTDGVSPTTATGVTVSGITSTALSTSGAGVELDITGDPSQGLFVRLFVAGYRKVGTLTATLNGATTYTDSSFSWGDDKIGRLYLLHFQPDNVSDLLHISFTGAGSSSNSHVLLSAVTVAVPTPASLPAGLGLLSLITLRRRRR